MMDKQKQKQIIIEIMNDDAKDKQQTAVEYLVKELIEILGYLSVTPKRELLILNAVKKAKQMHREQINNGYEAGFSDGVADITTDEVKYHNYYNHNYYTQTYGQ